MKSRTIFLIVFCLLSLPVPAADIVVPLPPPPSRSVIESEAAPEAPAGAVATIVRPTETPVGGLIKLRSEGSVGTVFAWSIPENLPESHFFETEDRRTLIISSATAGRYSIGLFASDGKNVSTDRVTIIVGDDTTPTPSPTPTPNPTPLPVPTNLQGWVTQNIPATARSDFTGVATAIDTTINQIDAGQAGSIDGAYYLLRLNVQPKARSLAWME
ncbi:MAG: hypothetical protein FWD31_15925, partial [Planctomycetaceae bacterium]|nr:hypothetical protein [Planctomycetaceae bacterium]